MKKILIVDDEKGIVNFLKIYFEHEGFIVYSAYSAEEALEKISTQLDIILMDIMMPGLNGIELCQLIRDKICCPIVFVTAKVEENDRIKGLSVGGDDYIIKPFSIEELSARVKAHLRREDRKGVKSTIRFFGKLWIDYSSKQVGYEQQKINLTPKEYDIVDVLSQNRERVFSKEYLYEKVWGYDAEGDAETAVMEHIKRIRKKLQQYDVAVIETVWGVGYKWVV